MSAEELKTNNTPPIDPSLFWESSGILSKATSQGALFSLYLAMQQHALAEPIHINSADTLNDNKSGSIDSTLEALNHYPKAKLEATPSDWKNMSVLSELMKTDIATARLFHVMNPQPLAQTNNKLRLPDDVIDNCSYGTQKRVTKAYSSTIDEDNTMLFDVVEQSHAFNESHAFNDNLTSRRWDESVVA
ncbi:MAG: VC2046/SO_2500 family protein [Pseudomonadota bacterium]